MYTFIKQEWKFWLKGPMVWIFLMITALLVFGASSSDSIVIGGGIGSTHKNAPFVIQNFYGIMSLVCLLMTTSFMNAGASRDFQYNMYQLVFSSPIRKRDYFFGKFIGLVCISVIPLLGISLGSLIAPYMPWVEANRYGEIIWGGHVWGILGFALPNVIIAGVLLYSLALIFRNNIIAFVGTMAIIVLYAIAQGLMEDMKNEWLANLLDPFGMRPFDTLTKYLTVDEKNSLAIPLKNQFLWNRLLWLSISMVGLFFMYNAFSFNTTKSKNRKEKKVKLEIVPPLSTKKFTPNSAGVISWSNLRSLTFFEFFAIIKNPSFIIIMIIGAILFITSMVSFTGQYGENEYPTTLHIIERAVSSFTIFSIGFITFYTGVLVWKERDAKMNEIQDATPMKTGLFFTSKFLAVMLALAMVQIMLIVLGVISQLVHGFTHFKFEFYFGYLFVFELFRFSFWVVLALFMHHVINNRYIAYFAFITFLVVNLFIWDVLKVSTKLVKYGSVGNFQLSDMNGFGPFGESIKWFSLYWALGAVLLLLVAYAYMLRGKETTWKARSKNAWFRLNNNRLTIGITTTFFILCGAWIYYNTMMLNKITNQKQGETISKNYELLYKKFEGKPQPSIYKIVNQIDIDPSTRNLFVHADSWVTNRTKDTIKEIYFTMCAISDSLTISIPNAKQTLQDDEQGFRIFSLQKPLLPGDSTRIHLDNILMHKGFKNNVDFVKITSNGSFFDNSDIHPLIGYVAGNELEDKNKRKELKLPPRKRMQLLSEDSLSRMSSYLPTNSTWVDVTTTISTAIDQIAIAPGSLVKSWTANGKKYFTYTLDKASVNFYSILSARYEVARSKWNGIDIEVYYDKQHVVNVPNMQRSVQKSLEYYTENFGPYYHKQARIIEFPKYASFAQAFPGTMPYSENIGFIKDLRDVKGKDIDFVYYVVAHEMGHQYWAHQVIGPDMQGSEWMSEGFAQYSALMVMEKEYGKTKMKRFLEYEMNNYLQGRSDEREAEKPISRNEHQPYIYYQKASVAMYYLKEMIGEDKVNEALQSLITQFAYKEPPYPTALNALAAFRKVTPDSLQYIITDLFERITLFDNRIQSVTSKKIGQAYEVRIETFSDKFYADSLGKENSTPLNDFMDIGVFGKEVKGVSIGNPLIYQRVRITKRNNSFVFRTKEKPLKVGIDPYNYLVDRITDDNLKSVN
jgi:ABC-2 type transport system permease protein